MIERKNVYSSKVEAEVFYRKLYIYNDIQHYTNTL